MSAPSAKEFALRWFNEVWTHKNAASISAMMAPDALGHMEGGQTIVGPDQFIAFHQAILEAMPDLEVEVLKALSDGDDACVLWSARGTHTGHGMGFAPTGKNVTFRGSAWFHVVDGQMTEGWDCWNQGQFLATLASA